MESSGRDSICLLCSGRRYNITLRNGLARGTGVAVLSIYISYQHVKENVQLAFLCVGSEKARSSQVNRSDLEVEYVQFLLGWERTEAQLKY